MVEHRPHTPELEHLPMIPCQTEATIRRPAPNKRATLKTLPRGPISRDGSFAVIAAGDDSVVRSRGMIRPNGLLRILTPFLRSELPMEEANELARLKALLEAPGPDEGSTDAQ
jgi:hypothetical protein